jgi:hypothetical protein
MMMMITFINLRYVLTQEALPPLEDILNQYLLFFHFKFHLSNIFSRSLSCSCAEQIRHYAIKIYGGVDV